MTSSDWISRSGSLALRVRNLIDGRWQEPTAGSQVQKCSPRDGRLLCTWLTGDKQDTDAAVLSARRAFEDQRWSGMPVQHRKAVLYKLASLIEAEREELALLESLDVGKPISDALRIDVPMAAAKIRYCAEAIDSLQGKVFGADRSSVTYQLLRPLGVAAGIVGWNFPLVLAAMKIGPALATGNSLVLKPSEFTPLATARIAELALAAGVPEGVLNVIHGDAATGNSLARHRNVAVLSFTGSTKTGKQLLIASGESNMKRLILECGGKAPNIVFDDSPSLEAVANAVTVRAFWNQGEVCSASSRVLVQASIKDELLRLLVERASEWVPADPLKPETKFGALVNRDHQQKVQRYIELGEAEGATMVHQTRFTPPFERGCYVSPTIFDCVRTDQTLAQEEIFGPVLSVMSFSDEAEAIRIANDTIYGLTAVVWTKTMSRALRVANGIYAGKVVINAAEKQTGGPSDGVVSVSGHKQSGIGSEGGLEGLEAYMSKTAVQMLT
jgi:acyl-CoA reductase-like NAD-dependent aldehyde dehydrogenase